MPSKAKEEQQKLEHAVRSQAHEPGVRALHDWLRMKQDSLNSKWMTLSGDELLRAQGEAASLADVVRVIMHGPKMPIEIDNGGVKNG